MVTKYEIRLTFWVSFSLMWLGMGSSCTRHDLLLKRHHAMKVLCSHPFRRYLPFPWEEWEPMLISLVVAVAVDFLSIIRSKASYPCQHWIYNYAWKCWHVYQNKEIIKKGLVISRNSYFLWIINCYIQYCELHYFVS